MENELESKTTLECSNKLYEVADYLRTLSSMLNNRVKDQINIDLDDLVGYTLEHLSKEVLEVAKELEQTRE